MKAKLILLIITISFSQIYGQENRTRIDEDSLKIIQKEKKEQKKQIDGSTLTELSFEDINGKNYNLNSLKGKIIVLNFWFIQCKPCVEEFPDLNKLKKEFEGKPVEFFAVTWNNKNSLIKFLQNQKLNYKIIPNGKKIIDKFKIQYYPYNIIIDQNGIVEYINDVLTFNIFKKIERKIKKLLN
ncbi:TlpA family protein disulfide reductase [Mesoflavibacter profundi]|uniref:TlpA family protein disulfide reductase n=1 Tax=Mesoflavibacter profundi TaxID=2708110 RepID=UPI00168B565E|nr:TlpA disulfide reductase family protein [Mesoflavibacter profundi]